MGLEFLLKYYLKSRVFDFYLDREQAITSLRDVNKVFDGGTFCNLMEICESCDMALADVVNMVEQIRIEHFADIDAREAAKVGGEV